MFAQKKILIVEDSKINRRMLSEILCGEYLVLEAENGREALAILKQHHEEILLILLDIVMPVMDGYTFLSIVKADPLYSSIPVIVTTQKDEESDEVEALSNGATDFVAKPYRPRVILHRVASIINLRETAAMINQFQYDRLTGVYSKEFFYRCVRDVLVRNPERAYDIVCSDIENFKLINDVFGIPEGDRVLKGIAELYSSLLGDRGICGRLNADQFACLVEHGVEYTNEMFMEVSERIGAMANAKNIALKWGVYTVNARSVSVEQMCDRALLALRSIKGQYGKYFAIYDDKLRSKLLREQAITDGMESALAEGQFVIRLQPKYRIEDDALAGAEALVRWEHPRWGLLLPTEFVPLFEKNGFITKLDQFVWERVCALLRDWDDRGFAPISVSVNVSRADIYKADIADVLLSLVEKYRLLPARLHLEITESAYTEDPGQIIDTIGYLRRLGFVIEMDDFGSGYSSLNMLNQMPLDVLKLDKKFIENETAKPANRGILRFIIGLARWMNLSVVAEGVETGEQLERLREVGCDFVQGYYFAKPMTCDAFERLLRPRESDAQESAGAVEDADSVAKRLLLVIDEDAGYRAAVRAAFAGRFDVVGVAECDAALDFISAQGRRVAAIVLSLTLSTSAGLSLLEVLQKERSVWDIPVIATAPLDMHLEERAFEMGADDFACKPHSQRSLACRVEAALSADATRRRERMLRHEAYRDCLTGLLNRRGLEAAMASIPDGDKPLAVFLFDLDDLKRINDRFGHTQGDRCIRQFAEFLRAQTRKSDIMARYGGDEFIVVMRQMSSEEDALRKGEDICRAIRENCLGPDGPIACTAGVILWDGEYRLAEIIAGADRALYRAKRSNKGRCCVEGKERP